MLIHEAFEGLTEALDLVEQVLIPDHLDELTQPDWELLDLLHRIRDQVARMSRHVADTNRDKLHQSWVGVPTNGAPLRVVPDSDPEG